MVVAIAGVTAAAAARALFGDGPLAFTLGWGFAHKAPPRELSVPIVSAAILALVICFPGFASESGTRRPLIVRGLLTLGLIDVSAGLTTLASLPVPEQIRGPYGAYVTVAVLGLVAALGAAAAMAARWIGREPLVVTGLVSSAAVGLWQLVAASAWGAAAALLLGAAAGFVAGRIGGGALAQLRSRASSPRLESAIVAAVVLAAFAMRAALVVSYWVQLGPDYPLASDDGDSYDTFAWNTARGDDSQKAHYFYNLYVSFLAVIYRVFGHAPFAAGLIQSVLGAAALLAAYLYARKAGGRSVALLAAAALAGNTLLISMSAGLGHEALGVPIIAVLLALLASVKGVPSSRAYLAIGSAAIVLGIGIGVRDLFRGLPFALALWLLWLGRRSQWGTRRTIGSAGLILAALLVALPYDLYHGRFDLYRSDLYETGENFLLKEFEFGHRGLTDLGVGPRFGVGESVAAIARDPGAVVASMAAESWRKIDIMFFTSAFGRFNPIFLVGHTPFAAALELCFLALIAFGFSRWLATDEGRDARILGGVVLLYFFTMHVVLFQVDGGIRYRAPLDVVFLTAMSIGVVCLYRMVRSERGPASQPSARRSASTARDQSEG